MLSRIATSFAVVVFVSGWGLGQVNSPWLLPSGDAAVDVTYIYQNYQDFWFGPADERLPDDITQNSVFFGVEYALSNRVSLDLTTGYSRSSFSPPDEPTEDLDGIYDTHIGVRIGLVDEYRTDGAPTVAVRVGGIIKGSYEESRVHSPGDGGSGGEVALLVGKTWPGRGFGLAGNIGFRDRNRDIPAEFFGTVGFYKTLLRRGSFSFAYKRNQSLSGLDIGGPGFTPDRFPEVKEINDNLEFGIGVSDEGGRYYGFLVGRTVNGRNTGEKTAVGATVRFPF